jgi:hypothetical protein
VQYLRGKAGDAESIAPSLYSSRTGRRRETEEATPAPRHRGNQRERGPDADQPQLLPGRTGCSQTATPW